MDFAVTTLEFVAVVIVVLLAALLVVLGAFAIATRILLRRGARRAPRLGELLTVDGVPLHYVERGSGPPVVFLHGAKGSVYDVLLSVGPQLAERYRLVAFDRPGLGYSGRPAAHGGAPAVQAELIHSALELLGIRRPVIVAHSAGAPVALEIALCHPDDVTAVVTLGGYTFSGRDEDRWPGMFITRGWFGRLLRETVVLPVLMLLAPFLLKRLFIPGHVDPAYARVAPALALRPDTLHHDKTDVADIEAGLRDLATRYAQLRVPLVAVHGLADYIVTAAMSVRLAQLCPSTDLVLLEEVGHLPHFARPDAVVAAVDRAWELAADTRTFDSPHWASYTPRSAALGGEPAVPCTRNPL